MNYKLANYNNVEYMGDSVYIGIDPIGQLWIFTYNGIKPENEICLDDDTLGNLIEAVRKFGYKWYDKDFRREDLIK